jgi:hypothetical protein
VSACALGKEASAKHGMALIDKAEASEQAIASGKVESFDQFNADLENWKAQKRAATK